jgi:hypothetical protein
MEEELKQIVESAKSGVNGVSNRAGFEAFKAEIQRLMVLKETDPERVGKRIKQLQGFAMSLDDTFDKIPLRLESFRLIVSR